MLRKKLGILSSIACLGAIAVWCGPYLLPSEDLGASYSLFTHHAFSEVETYLHRSAARRWQHSPKLYAVYVAEAQNQWEVAEKILLSTDWSATDRPIANLLHLYHSYWSGTDKTRLITYCNGSCPLPPALQGLRHYLREEYAQAYSAWTQPISRSDDITDPWWQVLHAIHLSPLWLTCHQAHCCLELGDSQKASQLLQSRLHLEAEMSTPLEQAGLALLVWCWLEDPYYSVEERYQLIHNWLSYTGTLDDFPEIRHRTAQRLLDEVMTLWSPQSTPVSQQRSLDLLMILEQWHEEELLQHAIATLPHYLEAAGAEGICFLALLKAHAPNSLFYRRVIDQLTERLDTALDHYDFEPIPEIWQWLLALTEPSQKHIEQALEGFLRRASESATPKEEGAKVIEFYQQFFHSPETNERLSNALLDASVQYWRRTHQEEVARVLMEMALQLAPNPLYVRQIIQSILTSLFVKAESNHLLDRMAILYDTLSALDLQLPDPLYQRFDVANYLADAAFLYAQERYQAARSHALCILKFHPENQQACRMLGLCAYQLGNPIEAFEQLSQLQCPDPIVLEAIAWSQSSNGENRFLTASCREVLP